MLGVSQLNNKCESSNGLMLVLGTFSCGHTA